jgi:hypothetical protein
MNTRLLLGSSALFMGAAGLAASFLPHELLALMDVVPTVTLAVFVQLFGAILFGFAMVNWIARSTPIGGIYGRPIALGNLAHFTIGALPEPGLIYGDRPSRSKTFCPPTTVVITRTLRISSGGISKMLRSRTTKSASFPGASTPLMSSSKEAYAAPRV